MIAKRTATQKVASIALLTTAALLLVHGLSILGAPLGNEPIADIIGGLLSHAIWAGIFIWIGLEVWRGRKLTGAVVLVLVNGFMTGVAILMLTALNAWEGWLGGNVERAVGLTYLVWWFITCAAVIKARTSMKSAVL